MVELRGLGGRQQEDYRRENEEKMKRIRENIKRKGRRSYDATERPR